MATRAIAAVITVFCMCSCQSLDPPRAPGNSDHSHIPVADIDVHVRELPALFQTTRKPCHRHPVARPDLRLTHGERSAVANLLATDVDLTFSEKAGTGELTVVGVCGCHAFFGGLGGAYPGGCGVTDQHLAHVASLSSLVDLDLSGNDISDEGLLHLRHLSRLQHLSLWDTGITDHGLDHLAHLTELRYLSLEGTKVTDEGLAKLRGLTTLETLWLPLGITDDGLMKLTFLPNLKHVKSTHRRARARISDRAIANFKKLLPDCEIDL